MVERSNGVAYRRRSRKEKGKAKIGEPPDRSDSDSDEDFEILLSSLEQPSGPGASYYRTEEECLSKTLTAYDVIKENATLQLDHVDALIISGDPNIKNQDPESYSKTMIVFDGINRKYAMVLSKVRSGGSIHYQIGGGWGMFVRAHNLKAGDVVTFYEPDRDDDDEKNTMYVVKYFRKPADRNLKKNETPSIAVIR
ncbi:hypothetical protein ABFX02_14G054600 [Erythranthe guttata]|uniref:uncharacterized protein LOC105954395 n=1 Tax=Erythranthe guttata TaxID=4155 RepID=UPI00064DE6D0|nr:PREDICTED: uncharacterized protein LOC105954395 [Erythranthe guttata]|eukprot:XP_012833518.1 PREDICTED: uncharacterized protein LOC105954395 [Erythranthe guttata]